MFLFQAGPSGSNMMPTQNPQEEKQQYTALFSLLGLEINHLITDYNRAAIAQKENNQNPNQTLPPISLALNMDRFKTLSPDDIAVQVQQVFKDRNLPIADQEHPGAGYNQSFIVTLQPVPGPVGGQELVILSPTPPPVYQGPDVVESMQKITRKELVNKAPDSAEYQRAFTSFVSSLSEEFKHVEDPLERESLISSLSKTFENFVQGRGGEYETLLEYMKEAPKEYRTMVVNEGLISVSYELQQAQVRPTDINVTLPAGLGNATVVPATSDGNRLRQEEGSLTPEQYQQMQEENEKAWVTMPNGMRLQISMEEYDKGKFSLTDEKGVMRAYRIDSSSASGGGAAAVVTEVKKTNDELKKEKTQMQEPRYNAEEKKALKETMAAYIKLERMLSKLETLEKQKANDALKAADGELDAAKGLPEGKRAARFENIRLALEKQAANIVIVQKSAGRRKREEEDVIGKEGVRLNGQDFTDSQWQNSLYPTVNPAVKYGDMTLIGDRHEVKLQVIIGDAKDFSIMYPEFTDSKRTPLKKEAGMVVPPKKLLTSEADAGKFKADLAKLSLPMPTDEEMKKILELEEGKGLQPKDCPYRVVKKSYDSKKEKKTVTQLLVYGTGPPKMNDNWVYNPGTFFNAHPDFAVVMSGTYSVMDAGGISYPMGGIKSNGKLLSPSRISVFDNPLDPRYDIFYSKSSPATLSWVTTFYVDENGRPGMKPSLDVTEEERTRWPTWEEGGKLMVSMGKSTWEPGMAEGGPEFRMAVVIVDGKIGTVNTREKCTRKDFALALAKIPGLAFACQIDGSDASQTAIRDPEGNVMKVTGRGTINLLGFKAPGSISSTSPKRQADVPDTEY